MEPNSVDLTRDEGKRSWMLREMCAEVQALPTSPSSPSQCSSKVSLNQMQ